MSKARIDDSLRVKRAVSFNFLGPSEEAVSENIVMVFCCVECENRFKKRLEDFKDLSCALVFHDDVEVFG